MTVEANDYERRIIDLMRAEKLTLLEAMHYDMEIACIDFSSVLGICDYLEEQLGDLNKVEYYMMIYTGQAPDLELKRIE
jgi:DNA-binding Xre family transcriptional regulator